MHICLLKFVELLVFVVVATSSIMSSVGSPQASAAPLRSPRQSGELTQAEKDFDYDNMKTGQLFL